MKHLYDKTLMLRVFSDATVVAVDFTDWDKQLSIWLLADHWSDWKHHKPLVVARFIDLRHFSMEWPLREELVHVTPDTRLHWHIHDYHVESLDGFVRLKITGIDISPKLTIECKRVEFEEHPNQLLHEVDPDWRRNGARFARSGFSKLVR